MDVLIFITVLIFQIQLKNRRKIYEFTLAIEAQNEDIYEKHLEKMLAIHKDVGKAELEAVLLTDKEIEEGE